MNMCIATIEIQQTINIGCMTIEGFIHVNRITIILCLKMSNSIAINMIQSYSCSTQTPNNIYLGPTLIPKVKGVCDCDLINLGITSNTHCRLALN